MTKSNSLGEVRVRGEMGIESWGMRRRQLGEESEDRDSRQEVIMP